MMLPPSHPEYSLNIQSQLLQVGGRGEGSGPQGNVELQELDHVTDLVPAGSAHPHQLNLVLLEPAVSADKQNVVLHDACSSHTFQKLF